MTPILPVILIVLVVLATLFIAYSFYEGPFSKKFCDIYTRSWEPHADLVRKLNRYDLCGAHEDDVFDRYIYWNGEIVAAVSGDVLVFKGTDSLADIEEDLSPTIVHHKGGMVYTGISDMYDALKPQLDMIDCKKVTGWSLGAVLSILYSYDHPDAVESVIVFGQPPLFSKDFVDGYNSIMGSRTTSYLHRFDLIARPLLALDGMVSSSQLNAYRAGETTYINTGNLSRVFNHGLGYYHMSYLE